MGGIGWCDNQITEMNVNNVNNEFIEFDESIFNSSFPITWTFLIKIGHLKKTYWK